MKRWPPKINWPIKTKIVKRSDILLWNSCEKTEYNIFFECGYTDESEKKRINDFDCYQKMEFIAAFNPGSKYKHQDTKPLGVMRLVYTANQNVMKTDLFPTLQHSKKLGYTSYDAAIDLSLSPPFTDNDTLWLFSDKYDEVMKISPSKCVDLATIAVSEEGRNQKASVAVIARMITRIWEQYPIRYAFVAMDTEVYNRWKERDVPPGVHIPLGPSVQYWGSPTTPILMDSFFYPRGLQKVVIPLFRMRGFIKRLILRSS
jgi:hypothetical protein